MGTSSKDKRDIYYRLAKENNYRARSAYKLIHIDDHYNIIKNSKNIVDLCSAPGGWSQVLIERNPQAMIVSIDLQLIQPIKNVNFIQDDITTERCKERILKITKDRCDLIVCDGAPDVTGIHDLDEYYQTELLLNALLIVTRIAKEGAVFVGKCFRSEDTGYILAHFKRFFKSVEICKPKSSRGNSIECFIVCRGYTKCDVDPIVLDVMCDPFVCGVTSCGEGPCSDISTDCEGTVKSGYKPLDAPYRHIMEARKNNKNTKK